MIDLSRRNGFAFSLFVACLVLAACGQETDERSATQKTIDELQAKYDELVENKLENPVQWAADDLENIGDWEYRVVELQIADLEPLEEALNEFGNDRWEVFWIENAGGQYRIMLKRPSRSYLSRIPLSQIGRFVIGGSDAEE